MKYLLILSFFISLVSAVHAQNRIATEADRAKYGSYITPGDLIIDTPTRTKKDGTRDVIYYFMAKQWPRLREGGTVWLDGDKLGRLDEIMFCNTSEALTPWHIESASVKNLPDTRVVATSFSCHGLKNFELNGQSASFPGLAAWPSTRKFLTGAFGFHMISNMMGGHGYHITVRDGGTVRLNGFEAQFGFSGVRINGGSYDITVESIEINNFYIHDTSTGEGQYLGATHEPPLAKLKNLKIHNGLITRTAAEALQLQHLAGGADIHNVTIFAADVRWMNEFGAGQDTGIQWLVDGGENKLHHVIVDGYASMGIVPFGSDELPPGGVSRVYHVLFNDGRDTGMYLHNSRRFGVHWIFEDIYFRGIVATYYQQTGRKKRHFYVSKNHGTDKVTFGNVYHDGSKPKVFEDTAGIAVTGTIKEMELPKPVYVNSGFHEPAHKIKQWRASYGKYFPASKVNGQRVEARTQWDAGDIAIQTEGDYRFYKCIETHAADERLPSDHPYFVPLSWDVNGVRSDQPGFDASSVQSNFPPDDLRLVKNNYWKKLGLGFQEEFLSEPQ